MSLQSLEESIVRSSLNRIRGRDGASRDGERDALFVLFAINRSGDAPFLWRLRLAAVAEDAPRHDQDEVEDGVARGEHADGEEGMVGACVRSELGRSWAVGKREGVARTEVEVRAGQAVGDGLVRLLCSL